MKKLLALFFLIVGCQLVADISWSSPVTLSTTSVTAPDPQIVVDSNGNATAAWLESNQVLANYQPGGGSWGSATTLSGTGASNPLLGVDSNGNVTAVWLESGVVKSSTFNGTSWSSAVSLSNVSGGASTVHLAVDSTGNAVAIWSRNGIIESATQLFNSSWGSVNTLSSNGSEDFPHVSIGENGTIAAVWHTGASSLDSIEGAIGLINGSWTAANTVISGSATLHRHFPKVTVDTNGNAHAAWFEFSQSGSSYFNVLVVASSLAFNDSSWSTPTILSGPSLRNPADLIIRIGVDNTGNVIAFWTSTLDGDFFNVESAVKLLNQNWVSGGELVLQNLYAFEGDVAVTKFGDLVSTYMFFDGVSLVIQSAESDLAGVRLNFWSVPINVSTGDFNGSPRVASSLTGNTVNAVTVWISSDGTTESVQAATGSKTAVLPPTNLTVTQNSNNFFIFTEYFNTITWNASASPNIIEYAIYRNGMLITRVPFDTLQFIDDNVVQNGSVVYGVAAVDNEQSVSQAATISFP